MLEYVTSCQYPVFFIRIPETHTKTCFALFFLALSTRRCRQKEVFQRKTIRHRKLRSIDYEEFNITLGKSPLFDEACTDLDSLVDSYHSVLKFTIMPTLLERRVS